MNLIKISFLILYMNFGRNLPILSIFIDYLSQTSPYLLFSYIKMCRIKFWTTSPINVMLLELFLKPYKRFKVCKHRMNNPFSVISRFLIANSTLRFSMIPIRSHGINKYQLCVILTWLSIIAQYWEINKNYLLFFRAKKWPINQINVILCFGEIIYT